jgi:hypothetical protein
LAEQITEFQMIKRLMSIAFVVIVNFAVLALCLTVIEAGFRLSDVERPTAGPSIQWLQFTPFAMFTNPHTSGEFQWDDAIHNKTISAKIDNNQLGFAMREEVDFSKLRSKGENERVVIFTGGSAAWGVGGTSNETNVAGRMQAILNESQSRYRYTVLNLAMGGWVSFQQFIALSMFGRNLQPDWLVAMDGTNDVAVACAHSQGAGHVMHYALMEAYMKAYAFGQVHPVFYRSWIENQLVKHSVAYRRLTGQTPVDFDVLLDSADPGVGRSVIRPTTWADVERQLELYIQTEGEMVDMFPGAKVILSTQPLPFSFETMFGRVYRNRGTTEEAAADADLRSQLDQIRTESKDQKCGLSLWENARNWFMPASALRLEALANEDRKAGREVHYANAGAVFPDLMVDRNPFFIDPVHLNDAGMDVVAHLYSEIILAADLPDQFTSPQWAGKPPHAFPPGMPAPVPNDIRVVEATYGLSCKGFNVPPPAENRVRIGNATDVVAADCMHKHGRCLFLIDVLRIPDPAPNCGKDFSVKWRCGVENEVHQQFLPGEANEKSVSLSCPAG